MRRFNYWLSLAMIFVMPWMDMVHLPGLGTLSRGLGLATAAFWGITVIVTGKMRTPQLFHLLALLFVVWTSTTVVWSYDPERTWARMFMYARMIGLILILWDLYERRSMIHMALQAYILGAYVHAGSVIQNYLTGVEDVYGRFAADGNITNTTAYVLAMGLPLAWFLATMGKQIDDIDTPGWVKHVLAILNFAYVPVALMAIALSATRFGMIMAIPACLFGFLLLLRSHGKVSLLILILLIFTSVGLASFVPAASFARLAETADSIWSGDMTGRVSLWKIALAVWEEHPFTGVGSDAFPSVNRSGRAVHNTYLVILAETGVIGLVLYLLVLLSVCSVAWRLSGWERRFWLTLLLVWGISSMVLNRAEDKSVWLFWGLLLANLRIVQAARHADADVKSSITLPAGHMMPVPNPLFSPATK